MTMARSLSKWEYNWPNRTLFVPRRYLQLLSPNNVQTWKLLINSATYAVYFFCCSLVACRVQKEQENLPLIYFSKGKSQKEQKGDWKRLAAGWLVFSKCWFLCILFHTWELFRKENELVKKVFILIMYYRSNNTKFMIEKRYLDVLIFWRNENAS